MSLMQDSLDSLQRSGVIEQRLQLEPETILFGSDSPLDSIGFVTFVTDVEDRFSQQQGKDIAITLLDIDNFNENDPHLSAGRLAQYLERLAAG
ncbi:MAG: hypothetical protein JOZ65_13280 [Chloroflexi bacterium]|nr:hypothetical protein [Chloroflexota bacterium]